MGSIVRRNVLVELCNNLEEGKVCINEEIDYITLFLVSYIHGDRKAFINIKAQYKNIVKDSDISNFYGGISILVSLVSAIICLITLFVTGESIINPNDGETNNNIYVYVIMVSIYVMIIMSLIIMSLKIYKKKYKSINKWQEYVAVVLDQIDDKWEEYFDGKSKKIDIDIIIEKMKKVEKN